MRQTLAIWLLRVLWLLSALGMGAGFLAAIYTANFAYLFIGSASGCAFVYLIPVIICAEDAYRKDRC